MKQSEKSIIFSGIVLLFLAAFFTISIMVQFLNYGVTKEISAIFTIGGVLLSAYGYSSIFVPVFLFVSSLILFTAGFTKKTSCNFSFFTFAFLYSCCDRTNLQKYFARLNRTCFHFKIGNCNLYLWLVDCN